jgi:ABC-type hemin transport system ATPase subunit
MDEDAAEKSFVKKGRRAGVRRGPRSVVQNLGSHVVEGKVVPLGGAESGREAQRTEEAEMMIERIFDALGGEEAMIRHFEELPAGSKERTALYMQFIEFDAERRRQLMKDLPDDGTDAQARLAELARSLAGEKTPMDKRSAEDLIG